MLQPNPKNRALELILAMGSWGSGKTYAWASWAHWMRKTGAPSNCYVVNTDRPLARLVDSWEGMTENVRIFPSSEEVCEDYDAVSDALDKIKQSVVIGRNDLVVVDLIGSLWEYAQAAYVEKVFGKDMAQYFLEERVKAQQRIEAGLQKGAGNPLGGSMGKDWGDINKLYRALMTKLMRMGAHIFACSGIDTVRDTDDPTVKDLYRDGSKPRGQKDLGHFFDTVLKFQQVGGEYYLNTVRETTGPSRKRKELRGERLGDVEGDGGFVSHYLVKVAGWRI